MNFEWDERKLVENLRKHKVHFEEAIGVFFDPHGLDLYDEEHSSRKEDGFLRIGYSRYARLLIVSYTERNESTRIISARKAVGHEKKACGKNIST